MGTHMAQTWAQHGPRIGPEWAQHGPRIAHQRAQNGPRVDPALTQMGPKRSQCMSGAGCAFYEDTVSWRTSNGVGFNHLRGAIPIDEDERTMAKLLQLIAFPRQDLDIGAADEKTTCLVTSAGPHYIVFLNPNCARRRQSRSHDIEQQWARLQLPARCLRV
mgnify:CR=1 FL=1